MMPLIRIDEVSTETKLALWYMEESDQELLVRYPYMAQSIENMRSRTRRQERLCACALLEAVTGDRQPVIHHNAKGKPFLTSGSISISHTRNFLAMLYCQKPGQRLGIDIEWMNNRVERITDYFMRHDEFAPTLTDKLLNWSAKETCYKFFSEEGLKYSEMKVEHNGQNQLEVMNLKNNEKLSVKFLVEDKYVLTWADMCNISY